MLSRFCGVNAIDETAEVGKAGMGLKPEDCKFPMYVVPISKVIEVTSRAGDLPCHEDLKAEGMLVEYDPLTMDKCLFLSHTWLRFKHPDSADGVKKTLINEVLRGIVGGEVAFHAYWFAVVAHLMADTSSEQVTEKFGRNNKIRIDNTWKPMVVCSCIFRINMFPGHAMIVSSRPRASSTLCVVTLCRDNTFFI